MLRMLSDLGARVQVGLHQGTANIQTNSNSFVHSSVGVSKCTGTTDRNGEHNFG